MCLFSGLDCPQINGDLYTADPVNLLNGNLVYQVEDVRVSGGLLPLRFQRSYNSLSLVPGPLGFGWTHSYNVWLSIEPPDGPRVYLYAQDGAVLEFTRNLDGTYSAPDGIHRTLTRAGNTWTLRYRNGLVQYFDTITSPFTGGPAGRLTAIADRNGNQVNLVYNGSGELATIIDPAGRPTVLSYSAGRIAQLIDPAGRIFGYQYDGNGDLVGVTYPDGTQATYSYVNHQMVYHDDPWAPPGMAVATYTYGAGDRVTNLAFPIGSQKIDYFAGATVFTDALGRTRTVQYDGQAHVTTATNALGDVTGYTYDAEHNIASRTDAAGRTTTYTYDSNGYLASVGDALGQTTSYTYDPLYGRLLTVTDPLGRTTIRTYNGSGNLLSVTDPLGGVTTYTYAGCCQPTAITDANGHTTHYGYDSLGNLAVITDALGYGTHYTYDALGRPKSETDANGHTTTYQYDAAARPLTETNPLGGMILYAYDRRGNTIRSTDANGNTTHFGYDTLDRLVVITDALGYVTAYSYDLAGNRIGETDKNGHLTHYGYDALDRQVVVTDALGYTIQYSYNPVGNRIGETDANGNSTHYGYDRLDRLVVITDALGYTVQYSYDPVGNRIGETDKSGRSTGYGYDALDRLVVITDALGYVTTYSYDPVGNRIGETDANGNATGYGYDALDRLVVITDALGYVTTYSYDPVGNRIGETDANGHTTHYGYDALDRNAVITDALGYTSSYSYDPAGNLVRETDAGGHSMRYGFDGLSRLVVITDALGSISQYSYDPVGNRIGETEADGSSTRYDYDRLDRLAVITDALGYIIQYSYDPVGNRIGETDANGHPTHYGFDALDRQVVVTDALGAITHYSYDPVGNRIGLADPDGNSTLFRYDGLDRQIAVTDALGYTTVFSYDPVGNRTSKIDANGHATRYRYDALDRPAVITDALGYATQYSYDAGGNTRAITDGRGYATRYAYDALDRLVQGSFADGTDEEYGYDSVGNLQWAIDPNGTVVTYTYDAMRRLSDLVVESAPGVAGTLFEHYAYDALGRMTLAWNADITATWQYDPLGRVITTTQAGESIAYGYDPAGNLLKLTYPNGRAIAYQPDAVNRLDTIRDADASLIADYDYRASGYVSRRAYGNGAVLTVDYDAGWRVISMSHAIDPAAGFRYGYDGAGNPRYVQRVHQGGAGDAYSYDAVDQLTQVQYNLADPVVGVGSPDPQVGYALDGVGNRVAVTTDGVPVAYTANEVNEYRAAGGTALSYDANGNLVRKLVITGLAYRVYLPLVLKGFPGAAEAPRPAWMLQAVVTETATLYQYDFRDRLLSVREVVTVTASGGSAIRAERLLAAYQYDPLGRRIAKSDTAGTRLFFYDDERPIEEQDGAGATVAQTVYGRAVDEVLLRNQGGSAYWFHEDGMGSVTHVTNSSGDVVEQYSYDVYGQPAFWDAGGQPIPASAIGNPFLFTGREYDGETGLYHYRARAYDPALGRFLQRDPLGNTRGMNLYTYVSNNPVRWSDPYGLCQVSANVTVQWTTWSRPQQGNHGQKRGQASWGTSCDCQAICDVIKDECPGKCRKAICRSVTVTIKVQIGYVKGDQTAAAHEATHAEQMRAAAEQALQGLDYSGSCASSSDEKLKEKCEKDLCKDAKKRVEKGRKDWLGERARYNQGSYERYRQDPMEQEAFKNMESGEFPPGIAPPREFAPPAQGQGRPGGR